MPSEYVNFDELKRATSIEYVASWLNLDLKPEGRGELRTGCPLHGSERGLAILPNYVNKDGSVGKFTCWACKPEQHGDLIGLIAHVKNVEIRSGALLLKAYLWPSQPLKELDYLMPDAEIVQTLGLPAHVAKAIGAGYAPRGIMAGRLAIPMRTPDGKLVGYVGIGLDLEPEIKFPKNFYL